MKVDLSVLRKRSEFILGIRRFFEKKGFWEVETSFLRRYPNLDPHVEPLEVGDLFLHTSPEYPMKKLLALGADKIFQICKVFRNDPEDELHLKEFTMLEWYEKKRDYLWLIDFTYELLLFLADLVKKKVLEFKGRRVKLGAGYELVSLSGLFEEVFGRNLKDLQDEKSFKDFARSFGYKVADSDSWADVFHLLYVDQLEGRIAEKDLPVFLVDFPVQLSVMARPKENAPWLCERVEMVLAGVEVMNGYSELTDPELQRKMLLSELKRRNWPEKLLDEELLFLLPRIEKAAGASIGVDRLFMLFEGRSSIQEVVFSS